MYKVSQIKSIGELDCADGGKNLTPIFKGSIWAQKVKITIAEWLSVKGNKDLMKEMAIKKLNGQ